MDRLWTPWRYDFVSGVGRGGSECVFCRILAQKDKDVENYVLFRGRAVFAILNLYPYTVGHLLIIANRHIASLREAADEELHAILEAARACEIALQTEYHPEGFNLGFNIGKTAGAGVEHHLHMHAMPRWVGDANFLTVVSETRVLPEELPTTYKRLLPHFRALA